MPAELVIAPEAETDLLEAYVWYEQRRAGLGEEFLSSSDAAMETIRRRPEMYPIIYEGFRRCLMRRFPYAIFFGADESTVAVYGELHTARDPEKWRARMG